MATRTRFVFLMHPKEFKEEKAGTGRLTQLCLPNSELHMSLACDEHPAVRAVLGDPRNFPVLLYPGRSALNLSEQASAEQGAGQPNVGRALCPTLGAKVSGINPDLQEGNASGAAADGITLPALRLQLASRQLVVFLLDATWSGARKMLRLSPGLQRLPRLMFTPSAPSRYVIKQQPQAGCLSTLEAVHELLTALERAGLDAYPQPDQLLEIFRRMQEFQIRCAADPSRPGYRRKPYGSPGDRRQPQGESGTRRQKYLRGPAAADALPGATRM